MSLSILDPIAPAIERTRQMLFAPFQIEKWFTLGFCAWLSFFGSGGGSFSYQQGFGGPGPGQQGGQDPKEMLREVLTQLRDNIAIVLAGALCLITAMLLIYALLTWLSSRGHFMFIDGVARNRGAVVEPWGEYRAEGNSLFQFRFWFGLAESLAFLLLGALCFVIALPDIRAEQFGTMAIVAIVLGAVGLTTLGLLAALVNLFLLHFVAPIMYWRRLPVMAGWSEFGRVLGPHKGALILYVLFQIVMGIAIALLSLMATCLTCCCAMLPYIGTVILLPLFVFHRSYTIYFLEQLGPEWQMLRPIAPYASGSYLPPEPPPADSPPPN